MYKTSLTLFIHKHEINICMYLYVKGYTRAGAFPYTLLLLGSGSEKRGARIFEVIPIGQKRAHTLNPIPRDLSDDKRLSLPSMKVSEVAWTKNLTSYSTKFQQTHYSTSRALFLHF